MDNGEVRRIEANTRDLSRRVDAGLQRAKSVKDLFNPDLIQARLKIGDYSLRLFKADPLKLGLASLDLYWRKGVYDTFSTGRKVVKGRWSDEDKAYMEAHLLAAVGYFHDLIGLIVEDFGWSKKVLEEVKMLRVDFVLKFKESKNDLGVNFLREAMNRCLVCLGDVSRYQLELSPDSGVGHALRHYKQAVDWMPHNGTPFNQIASLTHRNHHGLESVFFYLLSGGCQKPFQGSEANLKRILEAKAEEKKGSDLELCVNHFLSLVKALLFEKSSSHLSEVSSSVNCYC